ncbi:hypothetical protein SIN8267_01084 [Sinobacterium norvegicum]|uniref:Uncharacterized protein n=1 Tax=Sinobacterium norvegicum TaxID=1641715 RepID=A0ABM9ACR5_9GAMM|nr:hypothetical protein [Sinobacterium norvegicum]CAH0990983.1 hypothetical protein SIN8267_01084 [Sinobacterium norvegicum]
MLSDQGKNELKQKIKSNQHEVFVVSIEEMDAIVRASPKGNSPHIKSAWQSLKGKAEAGAGYYASADDLRTLSKLVGDLGGFTTKAYVKTYGGKPHIVLKGHPGLRHILTGTKYGIKNPKVITMGLGKAGAIHAAKQGGIISVVLLSIYRVADYFLTDQATLSQLVGSLATDVVKVGFATGASIVAASALVGLGLTLAIGPMIAVVAVGVLASMALGEIDNHYGITDRIILGLDELNKDALSQVQKTKKHILDKAGDTIALVIDYAADSAKVILISAAKHQLYKFLSLKPRAL